MKHYTDSSGEIFAFESDGSQDHLIKSDMQPVTQAEITDLTKPTREQLAAQVTGIRKQEEAEGVTVNGIRYAGDEGSRQALREAIEFMEDAGTVVFSVWKDSDGQYHPGHPLADVKDAHRAVWQRRSRLIELEGQYVAQVLAGDLTDLTDLDGLDWSS
jgi:hypothetical protein